MGDDIHWCPICGQRATELHHRIFRSQNKALENCKLNHIYLCAEHHRGTKGVHGKGKKLDRLLKLQLQNDLEILFDSEFLSREDIRQVLQISEKATDRLCKTILSDKGKFAREDVIRACMVSRIAIEEGEEY